MWRICGLLLLTAVSFRPADATEIRDLTTALDGAQVLLSFRLDGAFDERLVERVESGLPTSLTYDIELMRDRKRWFDRNLDEASLTVIGMYDAVRREYLVNFKLDGKLLASQMVHDLEALERAMTRFERLPALTLGPLEDDRRLLVRVRAELGTGHLLGFIPTQIETDWVESPKFHPPAELVH